MHNSLLEVTKQQMCMKYCSSVSVAGLMVKCWPLCKLVVYLQQGHCPTSNKSVARPILGVIRTLVHGICFFYLFCMVGKGLKHMCAQS